ncbi:hypothetical protein [Catellatospora methionotrophica]|uniref:hypothetical protein n=1 Tax=Catellatospora methionotrophica TaxID=121620 RepID=UPI0033E93D4F
MNDHPHRARTLAATVALLAATGLAACTADPATPAAAPATSAAAAPSEPAAPPIKGKLRGYTTVKELTAAADLIARGQVEATGFRVDEVLRAANGATAKAGDRLTLTGLNGQTVDMAHMSKLEPGQTVVLYLAEDAAAAGAFSTLSGDFGVFDVTGSDDAAAATTRSQAMAVSGLLAEDPAASGKGFRTTLGQLRAVAAQA